MIKRAVRTTKENPFNKFNYESIKSAFYSHDTSLLPFLRYATHATIKSPLNIANGRYISRGYNIHTPKDIHVMVRKIACTFNLLSINLTNFLPLIIYILEL